MGVSHGFYRLKGERYKWLVLLTVSVGSFVASLDISVLTVCLPALAAAFKTDSAVIGWVNVVYLITSQSLMFSLARIGDARGRKMIYMLGLALYTAGLILCSLSLNIPHLIVSRAIQGVGAASIISLSTAIAVAVFPGDERGRALGVLASVDAVGLIAGPIIGGTALDMLGWRAIFFARVPVALAAMVLTWFIVDEQKDPVPRFHFDFGGASSLFGCLTTALLFLNLAGRWSLFSPPSLALFASALVMLAIFVRFEKRSAQPIVELALFRNPALTGAALTSGIHASVVVGAAFLLPFYLTEALGYSASMVGLFFSMLSVPFLLLSPLAGRVSEMISPKFLSALGVALACVALFFLGRLGNGPTPVAIALCVCLIGTSYGVFIAPTNSMIMNSVPRDRFGTASGIIATTRQVGSSTGIAVAGALFASRLAFYSHHVADGRLALHAIRRTAVASAFQDTLLLAAVFGALGIITALFPLPQRKLRK
jgi:EmrB/QacA subfamily drug resistance transporter